MKVGDLVRLYNVWYEPGESDLALYMGDTSDTNDWREIPYVDCTILWNGKLIPFCRDNLMIVCEEQ